MAPDELSYDRAARRIVRAMAGIGALGTVAAFVVWDWKRAAGFLVGALISGLNFVILKSLVDRLGGEHPPRRGPLSGLRYLLLAGGAYVILRLTPISLPAVLAGIFVFTAAVFIEVLFEIAHAGK